MGVLITVISVSNARAAGAQCHMHILSMLLSCKHTHRLKNNTKIKLLSGSIQSITQFLRPVCSLHDIVFMEHPCQHLRMIYSDICDLTHHGEGLVNM